MSAIQLQARLVRPGFTLDVAMRLPARGVTALFGPSGCGKTSCLRVLAGLEREAQGRVEVLGDVWQDSAQGLFRPAWQRPVGLVFQEASLFAHLTVQGNIRFGQQRVPAAQRRVSLDQAVALLGVGPLMDRRPDTLSGGERQRVAIARALATSPGLLLLDEPMSALDLQRKAELLPYLQRLHTELDMPVVLVSHAPDEVARLSRHLVLMDAGRVLASGPTHELLTRTDLSLSHGDTAAAVLDTRVAGHDAAHRLTQLQFSGGQLEVVHDALPPGTPLRVRVQARDVSLCLSPPADSSILNIVPASVHSLHDDGSGLVMVVLQAGDARLLARITRKSALLLRLAPGQPVHAQVKGVAILD